jgi:hypothetical protein
MKTTKRPYFKVTLRRFIFRSQIFFLTLILTFNCHDDDMITPPQQSSNWSWRWILKYFDTGEPHLKKLVMIDHHLVVFIQHYPGELRGLWVEPSLKSSHPCGRLEDLKITYCWSAY